MRLILISFLMLGALNSQAEANPLGEKFCQKQARDAFVEYHTLVLEKLGVIQGYQEDISESYSQVIKDMDQREETYVFHVRMENDEEQWWVSEYKVFVEVWLTFDEHGNLKPICDLHPIEYIPVVDSSSMQDQ